MSLKDSRAVSNNIRSLQVEIQLLLNIIILLFASTTKSAKSITYIQELFFKEKSQRHRSHISLPISWLEIFSVCMCVNTVEVGISEKFSGRHLERPGASLWKLGASLCVSMETWGVTWSVFLVEASLNHPLAITHLINYHYFGQSIPIDDPWLLNILNSFLKFLFQIGFNFF